MAATTGHGGQTSGDNANEEGAVELKAEGGLLQEAGACHGRGGVEDGHAVVVAPRRQMPAMNISSSSILYRLKN